MYEQSFTNKNEGKRPVANTALPVRPRIADLLTSRRGNVYNLGEARRWVTLFASWYVMTHGSVICEIVNIAQRLRTSASVGMY